MVTRDGLLKILDFGLAKLMPPPLGTSTRGRRLSLHETRAGVLLGTLEYMSPEQATGQPVDARADQFAIGLILAEMATGQPVFRRDTPAQVLAAVIEREAEPLRRLRPDVPGGAGGDRLAVPSQTAGAPLRVDRRPRRAAVASLADSSRADVARRAAPAAPAGCRAPSSGELVSSPETPGRPPSTTSRPSPGSAQSSGEGKILVFDEDQLASKIRDGKLTGVELVRRDDEERWQPLFESRVFQREVPNAGDPREAARWRALRSVGGHFGAFVTVSGDHVLHPGNLPFWLGIWGALLAHPDREGGADAARASCGARALEGAPPVVVRRCPAGRRAAPVTGRCRARCSRRSPRRLHEYARSSPIGVGRTSRPCWPKSTASSRSRRTWPRARPTSRNRPAMPSATR